MISIVDESDMIDSFFKVCAVRNKNLNKKKNGEEDTRIAYGRRHRKSTRKSMWEFGILISTGRGKQ